MFRLWLFVQADNSECRSNETNELMNRSFLMFCEESSMYVQQISRTRKHLYIFQIYSVCSVVLVSAILVMLIFSQRSWHCVLYFLEIPWCLGCSSQLPTKPNFKNIIYFSHWHILTSIDNRIKMSCEHVFEFRFCKMQGQEAPCLSSMFSHTIAREVFTILKYFDNCLAQHSTLKWITA